MILFQDGFFFLTNFKLHSEIYKNGDVIKHLKRLHGNKSHIT